jgi:hypothetical protein
MKGQSLQAKQTVCCVPFCGKPLYDHVRCETHSRRMEQRKKIAEMEKISRQQARHAPRSDDTTAA